MVLLVGALVAIGCATPRADAAPPRAGGTGGAAAAQGSPAARSIDSVLALATFDSAWARINATYYDSTFRGIDWAGIRAELRPRAAAAPDIAALRNVIREMMGRLGESHFTLIPAERANTVSGDTVASAARADGDAGLTLGLGEGRVLVARVDPASPAWAAGVRPGWTVDAIDGDSVAGALREYAALTANEQRLALPGLVGRLEVQLEGPVGASVPVAFRDAEDRPITRGIVRQAASGRPVAFGNLPPIRASVERERLPVAGGGCVGVVRFSIWLPAILPALDSALTAVRDCRGLVIDLRGNPGGLGAMAPGLGGYLLDSAVSLGTMRMRSGELRFVVNPRYSTAAGAPMRPFAGRVALVVDERSASTSEVFAAGLQVIERARVFGRTTAGQALPAYTTRLPNGDVLLHAFADLTGPDGTRIEARGVVPDERVPLERATLRAEGDPPLARAVRWAGAGAGGDTR